jgi:hypothetical protein
MTPEEMKAYIDAKFVTMFWNQVAMVVCLVGILVAKFMIFWQLYSQTKLIVRILR